MELELVGSSWQEKNKNFKKYFLCLSFMILFQCDRAQTMICINDADKAAERDFPRPFNAAGYSYLFTDSSLTSFPSPGYSKH